MPAKGTQYQSPIILKLLQNREEQLAAEALKKPEESDHSLQLFTSEPTGSVDFGSVMEWVEVFVRVFWLALLSGSFLLIWVFGLKLVGR